MAQHCANLSPAHFAYPTHSVFFTQPTSEMHGPFCGKELTSSHPFSTAHSRAYLEIPSSRNGKAVRLSYDHKGSDANEAKRIIDLGGFMMNNRVNGELSLLVECLFQRVIINCPFFNSLHRCFGCHSFFRGSYYERICSGESLYDRNGTY
jgi:hypothetical protein